MRAVIQGARAKAGRTDIHRENLNVEVQSWNSPSTIEFKVTFQMADRPEYVAAVSLDAEGAVALRDFLNEHIVTKTNYITTMVPQVVERQEHTIE